MFKINSMLNIPSDIYKRQLQRANIKLLKVSEV